MDKLEEGNVVRYCKPSNLEDGKPTNAAFMKRPERKEQYLSTYWLEYFKNFELRENVAAAKKYMEKNGFSLKKNGGLATLDIKKTVEYIRDELNEILEFKLKNSPHCGIFHTANDLLIAELLVECVESVFKAGDV